MNRLTHTLWSSLLQWMILLYGIMLLPLSVCSQTYSWKQVAPFPYYRAEHTLYGNNIHLVYGRIIDSLNESDGRKTEIGTTPFFMTSSDGKTWNHITPKALYPADKAGTGGCAAREEEIVPLKILFLKGSFITLARNVKKEQKIYRSEDGNFWYPTGIDAASMHFIKDRLIVEHNLTFSVSVDGKKWDTYGSVFPDDPERHKSIAKEYRTITVVSKYPTAVSFNVDSTRGYYTDSSYVVTDNDRTVGISRDGVHWRVVERPIFENDSLIEDVIGYTYGNHRFMYVTSPEEEDGLIYTSTDGKKWEKTSIDTVRFAKKIDDNIHPTRYRQFFFHDSLFFVSQIVERISSSGGMVVIPEQYLSVNGRDWKMHTDSKGRSVIMVYPPEIVPGERVPEIPDTLGMHFRLGPNGTREPVCMQFFARIVFLKDGFVAPAMYKKTMYQSFDGYTWQMVTWNIDTSALFETDPFYKENRLFVDLFTEVSDLSGESTISKDNDSFTNTTRSGYIRISKDRRTWDTVVVDSLLNTLHCVPDLRKYPDGLIISACGNMQWFSTDGRRWSVLDITRSLSDSCRANAKLSASGKDLKIYIFPDKTTKLSNASGTQWFPVTNNCKGVMTITCGNGHFVAAGENGKIWVLEKNK